MEDYRTAPTAADYAREEARQATVSQSALRAAEKRAEGAEKALYFADKAGELAAYKLNSLAGLADAIIGFGLAPQYGYDIKAILGFGYEDLIRHKNEEALGEA